MANGPQTDDVEELSLTERLQIPYQDGKYRAKDTNSLSSSGNSSMEGSVSSSTRSCNLHGQSLRNSQESNCSEFDVEEDIGDEDLFGYGEEPSGQISNGNEIKDSKNTSGIGVDQTSEPNTKYIETSQQSHLLNRDNGKIANNSDNEDPGILLPTELNGIGYCETMLHSLSIESEERETTLSTLRVLQQAISSSKNDIQPKGYEKKPTRTRQHPFKRNIVDNINGPPPNDPLLQFPDHNVVDIFCTQYAPTNQLPPINIFVQNQNQLKSNYRYGTTPLMNPPETTVDKLHQKVNSNELRLNYVCPQNNSQHSSTLDIQNPGSMESIGLNVCSPPPPAVSGDQTGYHNVYKSSPIYTSKNNPQIGSINKSLNGSNSSMSSNSTRCYSSTHDIQNPGSMESIGLNVCSPPTPAVSGDQTGYHNVYKSSPIYTSKNIPHIGSINKSLNGSNSSMSSNSTRCYSSTHDIQNPGSVESIGLNVCSPPTPAVSGDQTGYHNVYKSSPIYNSQNIPQIGSINKSLNGSNSSLSSNSTRCYSSTHDIQNPGSVESIDLGSPSPVKNYGPVVDRQYSRTSCGDFVSIGTLDSASSSSGSHSPSSISSSPRADVPPISTIPTPVYESINRLSTSAASSSSVSPLHRPIESALPRLIPIPNSFERIDDGGSEQPIKARLSSQVSEDSDSDSEDDGNTEAHYAGYTSFNSIEQLENSISNKREFRRNINISNKNKRTPLYIAVIRNNRIVVPFLLDQGADPSKLCFRVDKHKLDSKLNENVLHLACEKGLVDIVQVLLEHPAKHDILNTRRQGDNQTPLLIAINEHSLSKCRLEIIKMLLNNGASIHEKDTKSGRTPLMLAISKHELVLVLQILEGCEPWECKKLLLHKDYDGNTCLHMVAQISNVNKFKSLSNWDITQFASKLVLYGADLEAQNLERISPKELRRDLVIPLGRDHGSTIVPPPPPR